MSKLLILIVRCQSKFLKVILQVAWDLGKDVWGCR